MVRGFYSAAAGVLCGQRELNTIANNISNSSTAGYKSRSAVESSFGDYMVRRVNSPGDAADAEIGRGSFMTVNQSESTDLSQGTMNNTGRALDLAIDGGGFFLVKSDEFGEVLTRNGQFEIDGEGFLVLPGVGRVLDENKAPIQIGGSDFKVDPKGTITVGTESSGSLYIAVQNADAQLNSTGPGTFTCKGDFSPAESGTCRIFQGYLENSNTNLAKEMSRIISAQNNYQSCVQIIKIYDKINEISANQIARMD